MAWAAAGSVTANAVPRAEADRPILPLWLWMIARTIARPRLVPPANRDCGTVRSYLEATVDTQHGGIRARGRPPTSISVGQDVPHPRSCPEARVNREHGRRFRFTTWMSAKKESRPCLFGISHRPHRHPNRRPRDHLAQEAFPRLTFRRACEGPPICRYLRPLLSSPGLTSYCS